MATGIKERFTELIKVIMMSENLDELPPARTNPDRLSFISTLLKAESLPLDEAAAGKAVPRTAGLFASEPLPFDDIPAPRNGRKPFLATLMSRETLPLDPESRPGPAGRRSGH